MTKLSFKEQILQGIPENLPAKKPYNDKVNHAPNRKEILSEEEKKFLNKRITEKAKARINKIQSFISEAKSKIN